MRSYERKSLLPFTKWYVKMYHKYYKDKKIYEAITLGETSKLDKNLKLIADKILKTINRQRVKMLKFLIFQNLNFGVLFCASYEFIFNKSQMVTNYKNTQSAFFC